MRDRALHYSASRGKNRCNGKGLCCLISSIIQSNRSVLLKHETLATMTVVRTFFLCSEELVVNDVTVIFIFVVALLLHIHIRCYTKSNKPEAYTMSYTSCMYIS